MGTYKLIEKSSTIRNRFIVTIKADSNDADYITTTNTYSKKDFEEYYLDQIIRLKNEFGDPHKLEDYDGELEIPHSDWGRCHSLTRITVEYVDENGHYWDVQIDFVPRN